MKLLALDSSTDACSVAATDGDKCWSRFAVCPRQHNVRLAQMQREVYEQMQDEGGLTLAGLDAIVCGIGPGSFTGIRISVGIAQGLAAALQTPVIPVRGSAAMSQQLLSERKDVDRVAVAMDARMGEVYWSVYQRSSGDTVQNAVAECIANPATLKLPPGDDWLAVGDAWFNDKLGLQSRINPSERQIPDVYPDAAWMLVVAKQSLQPIAAEQLAPLYLRNEVAKKQGAQK